MPINSILRIDENATPVCLYTYDAQNQSCTEHVISQWSDNLLSDLDLIVLVPASWVYHSRTNVASKNTDLLNKSIPFAIEEELSNDVDDNYYAFQINDDGSQDVIAIEKKHLNNLNLLVGKHNLSIEAIHSEVDWLPNKNESVSIWVDEESSLIKMGNGQVMRITNNQIRQLLPVYAQDKKQIITNQASKIDYADLPIKERLNVTICCQYLIQNPKVNLHLNELQEKQDKAKENQWKSIFYMLGILVISWVAIQSIQWFSLKQSNEELNSQQKALFQAKFPDAVDVELQDPFAAMQSRMKLQNSQPGIGSNVLIDAVGHLGETLQSQPMVKLKGLRMVDQKLELQIIAPNMSVINALHQSLQQNAQQFTVQIGVNELGDDQTFKSIITMVSR